MPKSAKKPPEVVLPVAELGSNPMQKFVELLHWEYYTGVLTTKRYLKKNKSVTLKRYKPKAGVDKYVKAQIDLLPYHMQKIANAVPKPKSIDLMFTTFTEATEYILQNTNVREKVEILSLKKFGSEDIEVAVSMGAFTEEVLVRDIERYKYFYWQVDPPHMRLEDTHRLMRQFDTDDEDISNGYVMHVEAFYMRTTITLILMNLGLKFETLMQPSQAGVQTNLDIINEKLFMELREKGFSKGAMNMARASAAMLRAINNAADESQAGKLRGKLQTSTENEGDIENLKRRNEIYESLMTKQGSR